MIFNLQAGEVKTLPIVSDKYPEDITVKAGESAVFSAVIEKDGVPTEYTYQWYVDNSLVSDATTAVYTRKTDSDMGVYSVYCEITNKAGVVKTRTATLTVNALPKLDSTKPADVSLNIGESKSFNVDISEHGYPREYTYQWYQNGSKISGATSPSYTFKPTSTGTYTLHCDVTNTAGTVTSRKATITATKLFLYNAGNENSSITGGWTTKAVYPNADAYLLGSHFTVNRGSSQITISLTGDNRSSVFCTKNKIDLSKYKTLKIDAKHTGTASDSICVWTAVGSYLGQNCVKVVTCGPDAQTQDKTWSIDVSNLSGGHQIGFYGYSYGSAVTYTTSFVIRKVWLE